MQNPQHHPEPPTLPNPRQIEILDLRHFGAPRLRPLLQEQARVWQTHLLWDYRSATELLLSYLETRTLPGFVALHKGNIVGYTFCVYEGTKAVIGDLYAAQSNPAPLAVAHTLARHLLETLLASPGVNRIESQLLLYDSGTLSPAFAPAGFTTYPRLFLELSVKPEPPPIPLPGILVERWQPTFYDPAAALILQAYQGHIDANINDQYRTLEGSLRFLHNVIRFPGCGAFDPSTSFILRDPITRTLAAVLLVSRVAPEVAHITQLCVHPDYRRRGLGPHLLQHCLATLPLHNYRTLTLTVTEANIEAVRLYQSANFHTRHRFDALVHTR